MASLQPSDLPSWPRRMSAALAAAYLGISEAKFRTDVASGRYPKGMPDGRRRFWIKDDLDAAIDAERAGHGIEDADPYMDALR